ncbi:hypothetical protein NPIL_348491 [Nephila pilipes]|uniref:Uncharacterized protein n=1 Tax=Nephila pilipes TaxID=299642 RepID=A0A8X6TTF8_NEPPI|nr:hypothetical protein NPIL_348491 [Nephila pilipes]
MVRQKARLPFKGACCGVGLKLACSAASSRGCVQVFKAVATQPFCGKAVAYVLFTPCLFAAFVAWQCFFMAANVYGYAARYGVVYSLKWRGVSGGFSDGTWVR